MVVRERMLLIVFVVIVDQFKRRIIVFRVGAEYGDMVGHFCSFRIEDRCAALDQFPKGYGKNPREGVGRHGVTLPRHCLSEVHPSR